ILDRKTAAHEVFLIVDGGVVQMLEAHLIDDDFDAFELKYFVVLGHFVEDHAVRKTRATAALDVNPQTAIRDVLFLDFEDAFDLSGRGRCELNHFEKSPWNWSAWNGADCNRAAPV